jgi:hypothetical protein
MGERVGGDVVTDYRLLDYHLACFIPAILPSNV